jgi:hypothetical protein
MVGPWWPKTATNEGIGENLIAISSQSYITVFTNSEDTRDDGTIAANSMEAVGIAGGACGKAT